MLRLKQLLLRNTPAVRTKAINCLHCPKSYFLVPTSVCDAPRFGTFSLKGNAQSAALNTRHVSVSAGTITASIDQDYGADSIQVLEGLEPVRKRPGMYIGSTGQRGLHHLLFEVLDNAIDEVQGGHASVIEVDLDLENGWVTITDDGRGIPTSVHPRTGKSALETVMTVLHAGGKFGGESSGYSVSGGLHGVGVSVVNALSEYLEVKVWRNGVECFQNYSQGAALSGLQQRPIPAEYAGRQGTQIRFLYDPSIFTSGAKFDPEGIRLRLRELAFLNASAFIMYRAHHDPGSPKSAIREALAARSRSSSTSSSDDDGVRPSAALGSSSFFEGSSATTCVSRWRPGDSIPIAADGSGAKGGLQASPGMEDGTQASSRNGRGNVRKKRDGMVGASVAVSDSAGPSMDGVVVDDGWQVYHYRGGLQEFVQWMTKSKTPLHVPIYLSKTSSGVHVEVVLQWCSDAFAETLVGFVNSIRTIDGGTHVDGLRNSLTRIINSIGKKQKLVKEGDPPIQGDHVREGLTAIVSVKVPDPEFEGQTKTRLGNPEVRKIVDGAVSQLVTEWLELNPAALSAIVAKALMAARAADAAKKARELVRRKNVLTRSTLPGKLADCTSSDKSETEIFVVEGDSAGGSAKQARDRRTQAILPLRGKILNVERKDDAAMLKNNEISSLIVALGLGAKNEGVSSLRYNRVIILTDADVDGAHIRTLLLTFLFRYCRELFEHGHVYVAVPPLYKVEAARGKYHWCFSEEELQKVAARLKPGSFSIQRFKGLGEMQPDQLWDTTLNPQTRLLRRLTIHDAAAASHMLTLLMGDKVAPRRQLIEERGESLSLEDLDV